MVNTEILELIYKNCEGGDAIIYTDGSVVRGIRSGWGFSVQCQGKIIAEQNGSYNMTTSSMRMEEEAVTAALKWLCMTHYTGAVIATDSQCLLKKLEAGYIKPEWVRCIENSRLVRLTWIFTPGHAGVRGNERADMLAGDATIRDDLCWSEADVLENLKVHSVDDAISDSLSIQRMIENGIKRGNGCNSSLRGACRNRVNQLKIGTISSVTLRWWLERMTECIWSYPMHNEVSPGDK